ncbi:GNAT family N-acetyltransferase [Lewinella sp. 4G2]|uniref:GNAT family N-acetyltransferase n=1 Tax=Lewinella sp. 4G2 TaxID=1803372 RepID=UPI0007B4B7F8|nr:GNAT family N-acetyltransferase [Lewinella sp. 4G2]OAV44326.1 GCN5 family acetyltransferase [Lewinella sp. 4G2]
MPITTRDAELKDLPAIHALVAELAEYVGHLPDFTATIADYERDFAAGYFKALVATEEEKVVGMALYYLTYSTWKGRMIYLEDFVLDPAYRRRGIGQQLWDALLEVGKRHECRLLKWQIADTNTEALKFYAAQNAEIEDCYLNGKLAIK